MGVSVTQEEAERAGTVQPGEEGDLIHVYKYLTGECHEDRAGLLVVPTDRIMGTKRHTENAI